MSGIAIGEAVNTRIEQRQLAPDDVLQGYDAVSQLYPHVPSLLLWRAWEYAAYRRFSLPEPILDIGCGDGRYFRLVWPEAQQVVGVDMDSGVADAARRSGVYKAVHVAPAHHLPVLPGSFASAFANCALEHMDHLDEVLGSIHRSLRPEGTFLLSVVTHRLLEWTALPPLVEMIGEEAHAAVLQAEYVAYHHLVNPLTPEIWSEYLEQAGFDVLKHIPIVPEMTGRLFLLLDQLWHVKRPGGEIGDLLFSYLQKMPHFPQAFRHVLAGVLDMDKDWSTGSGAIFWARRRG